MKPIVLAVLLGVSGAQAVTPTEAYLAARDRAIAAQTRAGSARAGNVDEIALIRREKRDLAALGLMVRALVGPVRLPGFPQRGRANLDSVSPGTDFGKLDGIRVEADTTMAIVTTVKLFEAWVTELRRGVTDAPTDMAKLLTWDTLYTRAIDNDIHVEVYADLTLQAPAGVAVGGILFQFAQDTVAPTVPDRLGVIVQTADRVVLFTQPTVAAPIPACTAGYRRDHLAAERARAALPPGDIGRPDKFEVILALEQAAIGGFGDCYRKRAAEQPFYPGLVRQAGSLVAKAVAAKP